MRRWLAIILSAAVWTAGAPAMADPQCPADDPVLDSYATSLPPEIAALLTLNGKDAKPRQCKASPPKPTSVFQTAAAPDPAPPRQRPDEVVAVIAGGAGDISAIAAQFNLSVREQRQSALLGAAWVRLGIGDGRTPSAVVAQLAADPRVSISDANHLMAMQGDAGVSLLPAKLDLAALRPRATGQGVKVAVLDTAVDAAHPALRGAIEAQFDAIPDAPVTDRAHGTAIAGLIAGRGSMPGAAPDASLLIARIFDKGATNAEAPISAILTALDWAAGRGAMIVNMSFAGPRNAIFTRALAAARQRGITLIAAAGNGGPGAPFAYPAANEGVIAVTATDASDNIYASANRGAYILIAAPGVDVMAPAPQGRGALVTGTSFAAAILSGLAAAFRQSERAGDPEAFAQRLAATASDLGPPGRDDTFGAGRVETKALMAGD